MKKIKLLLLLLLFTTGYTQAKNQPEAWQLLTTGTTADLFSVHCINKDTVFACGTEGTIIKTIDGGENWTNQNTGTNVLLKKIRFANDTLGYAVGETGTIIKTINAGETWVQLISGTTENLNSVFCFDKDTVYAVGNNGTLLKTIDEGNGWDITIIDENIDIKDISFPSAQTGYIVGNYLFVAKSVNYSNTWNVLFSSTSNLILNSVFFINENEGFIIQDGEIIKTLDGGENWTSCIIAGNTECKEITVTQSKYVYVAGMQYEYQAYASIFINHNYGNANDWVYYNNQEDGYFYNTVDFATDSIGYVAGYNGIIRKTTCAGISETEDVAENKKTKKITIFPNPTTGNFIIKPNLENTKITISISDYSGVLISEKEYHETNNIPVNIENLSKGVYFISLKTKKQTFTKKIIKL